MLPFFLLFVFFWSGCAPKNVGWGPNFSAVDNRTRRVAVLKPELYSYEVSGGGVPEYRIDWSSLAAQNLSKALHRELNNKKFAGILIDENGEDLDLDTIHSFVQLTASAIRNHLYGKQAFIPQIDSFDYSVGPIAKLCDQLEVDAALFVFGTDENYSRLHKETLKKAARVKTAKSAVWGTLSILLTGYGSFATHSIPQERTSLCCVVADRQGRIIWFEQYDKADGADLSKSHYAKKLARIIVSGLRLKVK